jgi:hypothetical protein
MIFRLLALGLSYPVSPRTCRRSLSHINITIPKRYDFLEEYPQCDFGPLVQECGCCYAYGPIKAMSHRFCRALGRQVLLSSQYIIACDIADNECVGGCERSVLYFMEQHGITDVQCHPWEAERRYDADFCANCTTNEPIKRYFAKYGSTVHYVGVEDIQKAILLEGPVSASVATDWKFTIYLGGIYQSSLKGKIESGNHAVEIVGWGEEKDVKYWILLNQYGRFWGEKGRMRIKRGTNEALIESFVYGAEPLLEGIT